MNRISRDNRLYIHILNILLNVIYYLILINNAILINIYSDLLVIYFKSTGYANSTRKQNYYLIKIEYRYRMAILSNSAYLVSACEIINYY